MLLSIMPPKRKLVVNSDEEPANDGDDDYEYEDNDEDDKLPTGKSRGRKKGTKSKSNSNISKKNNDEEVVNNDVSETQDYRSLLTLKPDHDKRPIWVTKDNLILLEAFSVYYNQAYEFLIDIAEPVSRPEFIQSYRLTEDSLYAAVAVSRSTESIIKVLNILCKTEVPHEVIKYIKDCTYTFGKAKLVLKDNKFFIESQYPDVLRLLLRHPKILSTRIFDTNTSNTLSTTEQQQNTSVNDKDTFLESVAPQEDRRNQNIQLGIEDDDEDDELVEDSEGHSKLTTVSFMVAQNMVQVRNNR